MQEDGARECHEALHRESHGNHGRVCERENRARPVPEREEPFTEFQGDESEALDRRESRHERPPAYSRP